ncbi:Phosphotriesterase homology protein [subsurface metagenome]
MGVIDADDLGVTLPHEHLLIDQTAYFIEPTEASERRLAHEPLSLETLYWVRPHFLGNVNNMKLTDEKLAIKEALLYKWAGGNTIVEMSNIGLHRDPLGLARISRATGLNVIMGSGYYIGISHPPELAIKTEEEIAQEIVRDIMVGVDNTGVRAGIIGEIGCSVPLTENEKKILRASAAAQQRTGAALNIHPSFSHDILLEIIEILGGAGADLSHTVISHCELSCYNQDTYHRIAGAGCYIEFDNFGFPAIPIPDLISERGLISIPGTVWHIDEVKRLIEAGYLNQTLISHDICLKQHYVTYGGYGYAHILRDVVPWMRKAHISDEQIHTLMVENPKRLLSFTPVKDRESTHA